MRVGRSENRKSPTFRSPILSQIASTASKKKERRSLQDSGSDEEEFEEQKVVYVVVRKMFVLVELDR